MVKPNFQIPKGFTTLKVQHGHVHLAERLNHTFTSTKQILINIINIHLTSSNLPLSHVTESI
jgi:hypothetical protein